MTIGSKMIFSKWWKLILSKFARVHVIKMGSKDEMFHCYPKNQGKKMLLCQVLTKINGTWDSFSRSKLPNINGSKMIFSKWWKLILSKFARVHVIKMGSKDEMFHCYPKNQGKKMLLCQVLTKINGTWDSFSRSKLPNINEFPPANGVAKVMFSVVCLSYCRREVPLQPPPPTTGLWPEPLPQLYRALALAQSQFKSSQTCSNLFKSDLAVQG